MAWQSTYHDHFDESGSSKNCGRIIIALGVCNELNCFLTMCIEESRLKVFGPLQANFSTIRK